jgi:hypothetical protein
VSSGNVGSAAETVHSQHRDFVPRDACGRARREAEEACLEWRVHAAAANVTAASGETGTGLPTGAAASLTGGSWPNVWTVAAMEANRRWRPSLFSVVSIIVLVVLAFLVWYAAVYVEPTVV